MFNAKKSLAAVAFAGTAVLSGGLLASMSNNTATAATATPAAVVSQATTTDTGSATVVDSSATAAQPADPSKGGHVGQNGVKEELLTGDTATQATAAAQAAVPDGTIERVENDAEGATYEAHVLKADGSHVTVKMDASFKVTSVETGHK